MPARWPRALGWAASGWPDFAIYHPIFTAAPDAMVFGGDLPPGEVRRSVTAGAADVFREVYADDAARFGLTAPLGPRSRPRAKPICRCPLRRAAA